MDELVTYRKRIEELEKDKTHRDKEYEKAWASRMQYKDKKIELENAIKDIKIQNAEEKKKMEKEVYYSRDKICTLEGEYEKLEDRSTNLMKQLDDMKGAKDFTEAALKREITEHVTQKNRKMIDGRRKWKKQIARGKKNGAD